jgi:2-aminoadipate transaminase
MMRIFRKRMRIAVSAVKKYIPPERIEWKEPSGGYMIWIKLLTDYKEDIEKYIAEFGVMVHNGKYFFAKTPDYNYIRICISQSNETEIEEGIKRIGEAIIKLPFH